MSKQQLVVLDASAPLPVGTVLGQLPDGCMYLRGKYALKADDLLAAVKRLEFQVPVSHGKEQPLATSPYQVEMKALGEDGKGQLAIPLFRSPGNWRFPFMVFEQAARAIRDARSD